MIKPFLDRQGPAATSATPRQHCSQITVQFNRHLKFKALVQAWVKDEVKDGFRKALDREMVKVWVKAIQNVY